MTQQYAKALRLVIRKVETTTVTYEVWDPRSNHVGYYDKGDKLESIVVGTPKVVVLEQFRELTPSEALIWATLQMKLDQS